MRVGDVDSLGRVLRLIRNKLVLVRSKQANSVAVCEGGVDGPCTWALHSKNAMGVASQHAAAKGHLVTVTREVITEYDGKTPKMLLEGVREDES